MDCKYIEQLLERYWQCETSLEEEAQLRAFFNGSDVPEHLLRYKDLFVYQQLQQEVGLGADFDARVLAEVAALAAIDIEKEAGAEWLKDCRTWMYRGAWAEWEIENIEMAVPFSPEELRAKRNSILKHQSQMESAPFLGNDERLFWQRSEDRNRGTAALYDQLGLACYEAMEAFVEYVPL